MDDALHHIASIYTLALGMMTQHDREQSVQSHGGMYPFAYVKIEQSVEQAFILWTMRFTILHQFTHLRWE
jgi:hypothetical protein